MKVEIRSFSGIAPRFSPELLNESNGQTAENMSIKSGKIHPEKQFYIKTPDRDYVAGQVNDDPYHRIYFLDENGDLFVAGKFPDADGNVSENLVARKVDISAPKKPVLDYTSSPFLDSLGGITGGDMIANYGANSKKSVPGYATHIYSEYKLTPIDKQWNEDTDGNLFRKYIYNPWKTRIWYSPE